MSSTDAEPPPTQAAPTVGHQLDRHLLQSPAASSQSTTPHSSADRLVKPHPPTSTSTSPSHPISISRGPTHSSLTSIHRPPLPCPQARLLHSWYRWPSYFTLSWLTPLLVLGARRTLRHADLWDTYPSEHAADVWRDFEPLWQRAVDEAKAKGEAPRLGRALRQLIGWRLLLAALIFAWVPTDQLLGPQFLNQLVSYSVRITYESGVSSWEGYKWALMMFLSALGTAVANSLSYHITSRLFLRVRAVLMVLIYRKSLRVGSKHRSDGSVNNLMTSDTQKILEFGQQFQQFWSSPIIIGVGIYELWGQVGWSAALGLAVLIFFFPVAGVLIGMQVKYQALCAAETDKRIVLVNEMVLGVRVLKYMAWERPFLQVMDAQREKELGYLRGYVLYMNLTFASLLLVPLVMSIVIFASYAGRGQDMTPAVVFTTIALINVIRWPFTMLPMALGSMGQAAVAVGRIGKFLDTPELEEGSRLPLDHVGFEMKHAQFTWAKVETKEEREEREKEEKKEQEEGGKKKDSKEKKVAEAGAATAVAEMDRVTATAAAAQGLGGGALAPLPLNDAVQTSSALDLHDEVKGEEREAEEKQEKAGNAGGSNAGNAAPIPRLTDVNLSLRAGELLVVLGAVGTGKSTLLFGLLGEVEQTAGTTAYNGRIAYVPQSPFIVNDTLKANILFGATEDRERYEAVLTACALRPDLAILPNGDMTEIGERGINLSGGQKQRVQLARAAYQQSELVLLDDPLSAVDQHVAEHLFTHCIDGLMKTRARILVTHSLAFVDHATNIAMLKPTAVKDCYTIAQGTAKELREKDEDFKALEVTYTRGAKDMAGGEGEGGEGSGGKKKTKEEPKPVVKGSLITAPSSSSSSAKADGKGGGARSGALMEEEEQETGVVDWRVYRAYIVAGCSPLAYFLIPFCFAGSQAIQTGSDFWLAQWSNDISGGSSRYDMPTGGYLGVYGALVFATTVVTISRSFSVSTFGLRASKTLHHDLAHEVLRKSISWFDRTPGGRLINRFTKDIFSIDYMLPLMSEYAISIALQVVGTLIVIAIILPIMLSVCLPLVALYIWLTRYYRMSNRDLARIESISRTPVSAHFAETLNGAVSIRALRAEQMYIAENQAKTDDNTRALYYSQLVSVWLRARLDVLGALILGSTAVFAIAGVGSTISPGRFGLLISYALAISNGLNYSVMLGSMAESMMNSVERVLHYSVPRDEEAWDAADPALDSSVLDTQWPDKGSVVFKGVQLRYRDDLDLVLKGIDVTFKGGEKVGICGRTGSGKSSCLVALFRMVEPCGGELLIDGVNIQRIGITTLRSRISIIPQDATLFYGTLRYNCDPFNLYSDADIWQALTYVQLADVIRRLPNQLLTPVAEAGSNLSAGQRQLLCLARALLRKSRVVCLDEATANVDIETDALIQTVIREQFVSSTVITIAHRLNTVLDYDKILVMSEGEVAEWGSPDELRKKEGGLFAAMLQASTSGDKGGAGAGEKVEE